MKIVLATNNRHKSQEIRKIFDDSEFEIILQDDALGYLYEVEENGSTLEENAYLKAIQIYNLCQIPTIADDTGLEIAALDGSPGVYSARYSGEHGNDKANRNKVIMELQGNISRDAQFKTILCFHDGVRTLFAEGICKGMILQEEKGTSGFGYDCIFVPEGETQSFAEMSLESKNKISHRGRALQALSEIFKRYNS